jgi:hypothetical protein
MKKLNFILLFSVFAACTPMKILNVVQGDNVDFTLYKTYNFYEVKASGDTITSGFKERITVLKNAIVNEMNKRGYVQNDHPDLLINIGIVIRELAQTRTTDFHTDGAPQYMGQRNYSWKSEEMIMGHYREGAISLDIVDAGQKKMVWKGSIGGIVPHSRSTIQKDAERGMKLLFKKYPLSVR